MGHLHIQIPEALDQLLEKDFRRLFLKNKQAMVLKILGEHYGREELLATRITSKINELSKNGTDLMTHREALELLWDLLRTEAQPSKE